MHCAPSPPHTHYSDPQIAQNPLVFKQYGRIHLVTGFSIFDRSICATKERFGPMASAEAINKDTEWLTFRGWITKRAKRICPSKRRSWRCGTTHAGELGFQTRRTTASVPILSTQSGPHDCARRSADIALVAGGNRKRWIIATENMQAGDVITTSAVIGRMAGKDLQRRGALMDRVRCFLTREEQCIYSAVSAHEGDAYPLGALPVGTLVNNLEIQPGKGSEYIRAAGTLVTGTSQAFLLPWLLHLFSVRRD